MSAARMLVKANTIAASAYQSARPTWVWAILWVTAPATAFNTVTQHRFNRNSGITDTVIPGGFTQDGHPHLHFKNWTQIRLRQDRFHLPVSIRCDQVSRAPHDRCQGVVLPYRNRIGIRTRSPVIEVYQPNQNYGCTNDGVTISQGIGSGRADVYTKGLTGQMIGTEGLHGAFWLEVEVNPPDANGVRAVIESDYSNNVSRVRVTIP